MENTISDLKNAISEYWDLTVYFIVDRKTKYAMVMEKSVRDLKLFEIEGIDKRGHYWSAKEKAEEVLKSDVTA